MPQVFISYSHDSDNHRQIVLELSDDLRSEGIDCFIDQYINGAPTEGWQRWMEQQIKASDFVLVVCTELYLKRFNGKDRDGGRGVNFEGAIISQLIYDEFQQNTKFYPLIPDQGSIDHVPLILKSGSTYKLNEDYESICRVLTNQPRATAKPLGEKRHYPSEQTSAQSNKTRTQTNCDIELQHHPDTIKNATTQRVSPPLDSMPFFVPYESKGKGAIGIDEILKVVHQAMTNSRKTTIGQGASFHGIGGLGKTQLAVEYAHRYRDLYKGVVWLTVDQNIETQLVDLAEKNKWVSADIDAMTKMAIAKTRYSALSNTLLIFDNVDHYNEIEPLFPQSPNHILLTSRNDIQGFKSVPLDTLDEQNSLKLLTHESSRDIEEDELPAAKKLVEKFGGLPLALEMAGAYVDHLEISWNDYLRIFEAKGLSFIDKADIRRGSTTNHESNIRNTLSLSDELLESTDNIENIINLLAWGANEAIDQTLMAEMLNENEVELIEPIAIASKLKIIKKEEDGYTLHRLVRDVWKEQRPLDLAFAETVAKHLAAYMKSIQDEFLHLRNIDRAALQALGWVGKIENIDIKAQLLGSSAFPEYYMGRYKKGLVHIDKALALLNLKCDSPTLSDIYTYKGSLTKSLGDYKEAKCHYQQSLEMRHRLYPKQDHPDVASSLNNMGGILQSLGDYKEAKCYYQQSLEIRHRLYPNQDHPNVASSLINMGSLLISSGDAKAAKSYHEQALEMLLRLYPFQDHPDVAGTLKNVGFVLQSLGDGKAAKPYYQKALEMALRLYPDKDHPDLANSLNNMGFILNYLGDYKTAKSYYQQAFEMRNRLYPDQDHPDVATSLNNMGSILNSVSDDKAAKTYYKQAIGMLRRLYSNQDHPDTAASLNNLGLLLKETKHCLEAQTILNEALLMYQRLEIEAVRQQSLRESLRGIKKNIKMQKKPGSKKSRFCKDF